MSPDRQASTLVELARVLDRALDAEPDVVAANVAESVLTLCNARSVELYRLDPASGDFVGIAFSGDRSEDIPVIKAGTGTSGAALREGRPLATSDPLTDPRIILTPSVRARFERDGSRAVLAVPLRVRERILGILTVRQTRGYVFADDEIHLVQTFADLATLVLESCRLVSLEK